MKATRHRARRASLRAFARALGVRHSAVQHAIATGRLTKASIGYDARKRAFIADPETARREWQTHTRPRVAAAKPSPDGAPSGLARATQREREAKAKLAELAYKRQVRELVPAREVETRWSARVVVARTNLLGLPTRAKQRLPHLSAGDLVELDQLVREALEELAMDADNPEAKGESA